MDSDGSFYMENGTITGNKCNNSGGGLDIRCKTITIKDNSTISGNTCGGDGGAYSSMDMRRAYHRLQD